MVFKPIEWAWSVQSAHRELYGCLDVKVMPTPERAFQVVCPAHGVIDEEGHPLEEK